MKTKEIYKVWAEMTKEELVYLVKAQRTEMMVQAKKIEELQMAFDIADKGYRETLQAKKSLEFEFNYKMNQLGEEAKC